MQDKGIMLISAYFILIGTITSVLAVAFIFLGYSLGEGFLPMLGFGGYVLLAYGIACLAAGILLGKLNPIGWAMVMLIAAFSLISDFLALSQGLSLTMMTNVILSFAILSYLLIKRNLFFPGGMPTLKPGTPSSPSKMLLPLPKHRFVVPVTEETRNRFVKKKD
jgi:hypothetical protein